jgi:hypothetical protein
MSLLTIFKKKLKFIDQMFFSSEFHILNYRCIKQFSVSGYVKKKITSLNHKLKALIEQY